MIVGDVGLGGLGQSGHVGREEEEEEEQGQPVALGHSLVLSLRASKRNVWQYFNEWAGGE